ncbi:MAG: phosphotransferase family protein [Acidobacteria bacterium]|nr:phosphotransferase family protein [Acidobacteriota bacterium]MBV9476952.1 phosphotransferase family protein [Acidobacteriota bacterium]
MSELEIEIDEGPIRPGEELNVDAVDAWLKSQLPDLEGTPRVTQFAGGASNWTYRLHYDDAHDFVLRRAPAGTKAKSAHDMGREYRLQQALAPVFPYVPEMVAHCADESVIGTEFYVMRRIDGIIPRRELGVEMPPELVRSLCFNFLDTLIALHRVDFVAAGLEHLGKGAGYVRRQVDGWNQRYKNARTWNVPRGNRIMRWLERNVPPVESICITHNDFRFDNVVLHRERPTRIIGVLDWELATLGDPLMDLGNTIAYWVEADDDVVARSTRRQPTNIEGMLTRKEVVSYYCAQMGFTLEHWPFYEVFGLFRVSVIAQQIYYRYLNGQTGNPAFKRFWALVHYLHWRCRRLM